jgi:2-methylcitrate dehydratase PrpD
MTVLPADRTEEVYHKTQDIPSGSPGNPLKSEEHVERFWDAATYGAKALSKKRVEKIISAVHHLEEMKDVRSLIPLLSG